MLIRPVFPADAGMILAEADYFIGVDGVPRGCGDDPMHPAPYYEEIKCSPRMRG